MRLKPVIALVVLLGGLTVVPGDQGPDGTRLQPMWTVEVPKTGDVGVLAVSGRLVVKTDRGFTVFDGRTGRRVWKQAGNVDDWTVTGPVVVGAHTGYGPRDRFPFLAGLDAATGRTLWRRNGLSPAGNWVSFAPAARAVVGWERAQRRLTGLDTAAGTVLWHKWLCQDCSVVASAATDDRVVIVLRRGESGFVTFLDATTGHVRKVWTLPAARTPLDVRIEPGVVGVMNDLGMSVFDGSGSFLTSRRCRSLCDLARVGDRLLLSSSPRRAVVEAVDMTTGASLWTRSPAGWNAGRRLYATPYGVLASAHDTLPIRFDRIDPVTGTIQPVFAPIPGALVVGDDGALYASAVWRPGGVGLLRLTRIGDARSGRWDAAEPHAWHDPCVLPLPESFTASRVWADESRCEFTAADGTALSVSVLAVTAHPADAAQLLTGHPVAAYEMPVADVGDQAVADARRPYRIVVRAGTTLLEMTTGDERLRPRLPALARHLAHGLAAGRRGRHAPPPLDRRLPDLAVVPGIPLAPVHGPTGAVRLTSFVLDEDTVYRNGPRGFTKVDVPAGSFSLDGRWSVHVSDEYPDRGYDVIRITDHVTGVTRAVPTVKAPLGVVQPTWSRDGRLLLTVLEPHDEDDPEIVGFVTVDPRHGKAVFSRFPEGMRVRGDAVWGAPGEVLILRDKEDEDEAGEVVERPARLVVFTDDGRPVRELPSVRTEPLTLPSGVVSPSGHALVTACVGDPERTCVVDLWKGTLIARVPIALKNLIGWYDDTHLMVWQRAGDHYRAQSVDFLGRPGTFLAELRSRNLDGTDVDLVYDRSAAE